VLAIHINIIINYYYYDLMLTMIEDEILIGSELAGAKLPQKRNFNWERISWGEAPAKSWGEAPAKMWGTGWGEALVKIWWRSSRGAKWLFTSLSLPIP
jgi:hypothetical protein